MFCLRLRGRERMKSDQKLAAKMVLVKLDVYGV